MTVTYNSFNGVGFGPDTNGAFNITHTDPGADNLWSITVTDSSTVTSGYLQSFYTSLTTSGAYSTGNTQINAYAVDLLLGGTVACEAEGMYIYVGASGSPTLTSSNINGLNIYMDDLGSSPPILSGIQIHKANSNLGSTTDTFLYLRIEGSGGATSVIEKAGTATNPEYFMISNAVDGMVVAYTASDSATKALRLKLGGTVYNIPMVADSCS
jgi:hypothetical protein